MKNNYVIYVTILIVFLISISVTVTAADTTTGLISNWKFNEGAGTIASDSAGSNNGNLVNGPAWTAGKSGNALSFDGINDKVSVTTSGSINSLNDITITGWIYPRSSGGGGFARIIRKGNTIVPDGNNMYWEMFSGSNTLHFRAGYSTSFGDWVVSGIPFNQWTQVAVTYTHGSTSADPLIYINGALQTAIEQTTPAGTKLSDTSSLVIGDWGNGARVFDGVIDEIRVFNRLLSAADINALYSADLGSPDIQAPITSISSPASGSTVSGSVTVTATASDNVAVARVELWKDGALFLTDISQPYSFVWDTTLSTNGPHTLETKAYDAAGNVGSSEMVNITVNNAVKPNIVVIMTDDQDDSGSMGFLPKTKSLLASNGMTFSNSFVDFPLCCPSRATFVTGQDARNHGILGNSDESSGGYAKLLPTVNNTLPVWLQNAGYNTALVGKYLNGYGTAVPKTNIPPGWNKWVGIVENSNYITYYNYTLNDNGSLRTYGATAADYQTDVLAQKAADYITSRSGSPQPFFLWLTPFAPHSDITAPKIGPIISVPIPAPRHSGTLSSIPLPMPPSFNEADVSDKPTYVGTWPLMDSTEILNTKNAYQKHLESLLAVDDMVEKVVNALQAAGKLDNTIIIFTSDNGYFQGEHRKPIGKYWLYEPSIRVPLIVRGPSIPANSVNSQLITNVDLVSTILDYAGAVPGRTQDGKSLKSILSGSAPSWRNGFFFQGIDVIKSGSCGEACPRFNAIRTSRYVYAEHATGEKELYDLAVDPYQLASKHNDPDYSSAKSFFASKLAVLKTCVGSGCWYTDADPLPTTPSTPTLSLSASPSTITSGQSSILIWTSTNATSCTASGAWTGSKSLSGTQSVSPASTSTYTLNCTGSGGSDTKSVTVIVSTLPVPTLSLSASPTSITSGGSSLLTWSSTNTTSCSASGGWSGVKATSGTQTVSPTTTSTYTLTCTGPGGSTTRSATITVSAPLDTTPPTVSITSPSAGSNLSGIVIVSATASDDVGVVGVQFKIDGTNIGTEDLSSPYLVSFDTTVITNGLHTLTSTARDAAGNTKTSAPIPITVSNLGDDATDTGDINNDKVVDILDIIIVGSYLGQSTFDSRIDLAPPFGTIDLFDIMVVVINWGKRY